MAQANSGGSPARGGHQGGAGATMPSRGMTGMLDLISDGIAVLSRDGWVLYANETASELLGRPLEQLVGRRLWDEFPEAVGRHFHRSFEHALNSGEPQRMSEYFDPLGRWFEARLYPQGDELVSLFRDITDERQVEDDLREHVDRIAEAERIVGFGVWEWDIARGRVRWSDELHRIYGLSPGEFEGTVDAFVARLHPDDRDRVWGNISEALETLQPFVFEERIRRADGEERKLISKGRVILGPDGSARALVGVCHDVTDRTRAEQALGASERRMRAIVDNTPSMITVKDLEGRYLMGNAESERVLGLDVDELIGRSCADVFPAEVAADQRSIDRHAASEGEAVYGETILDRGGEPRTYVTVTVRAARRGRRPGRDLHDRHRRHRAQGARERAARAARRGRADRDRARRGPDARLRAADGRAETGGPLATSCWCACARAGRRRSCSLPAALPAGRRALRPDPGDRHLDGPPGARPAARQRAARQPLGGDALRPRGARRR